MRAPDEKFVALSDLQWEAIRKSLAGIVNADSVMVIEHWWDSDIERDYSDITSVPWQPLRAALDDLAQRTFAGVPESKRWTWKRQADAQRKTLASIEAVLFSEGLAFLTSKGGHELEGTLQELSTELENSLSDLNVLAAIDGDRGKNARKTYRNDYLDRLVQLWDVHIVPRRAASPRRRQRKDLIRFLLVCAKPLFPATTGKVISNFLDRRPQ